MTEEKKPARRRSARSIVPPPLPAPPSLWGDEGEITEAIRQREAFNRRRHLNAAVALALQAQRGEGELTAYFEELGKRFVDTLPDEKHRPSRVRRNMLTVIQGARA